VKKSLILVVALLLSAGLAWAEEPVPGTASPDVSFLATVAAPAEAAAQEGGCALPDLAGLSEDEKEAALLAAGFEPSPTAAEWTCPVRFSCTSLTNCGIGPACGETDIGPCCTGGGHTYCCLFGTIKVTTCPCKCTAPACASACVNSSNVQWSCS